MAYDRTKLKLASSTLRRRLQRADVTLHIFVSWASQRQQHDTSSSPGQRSTSPTPPTNTRITRDPPIHAKLQDFKTPSFQRLFPQPSVSVSQTLRHSSRSSILYPNTNWFDARTPSFGSNTRRLGWLLLCWVPPACPPPLPCPVLSSPPSLPSLKFAFWRTFIHIITSVWTNISFLHCSFGIVSIFIASFSNEHSI